MNASASGRELTLLCTGPEQLVQARSPMGPPGHAGTVHVWFADLEGLRAKADAFLPLLDANERERAMRFRFDHDRERFLIAHGVLRRVLGSWLARPPEEVEILRGEHGKPYVEGHGLHFNLSDTKDAVIVALQQDVPLGADLETLERNTDHANVARHYFASGEVQDIEASNDPKRRFLELWTRKEAVLKASGVGIMEDLRALRADHARNTVRIAHPEFMRMAADIYHVSTFHWGAKHIISIASPKAILDVQAILFPDGL